MKPVNTQLFHYIMLVYAFAAIVAVIIPVRGVTGTDQTAQILENYSAAQNDTYRKRTMLIVQSEGDEQPAPKPASNAERASKVTPSMVMPAAANPQNEDLSGPSDRDQRS